LERVFATVHQKPISDRIKERESSNIELKSSFRYDIKLKQPNPKVLGKIIAKTIVAFMNAEGGTVFIGVDDQGNVLELENDYKTLRSEHQNSDGFEVELRQAVENTRKIRWPMNFSRLTFIVWKGKKFVKLLFPLLPSRFLYMMKEESNKNVMSG
jgi:Putative DNA-binding domain